MITDYTDIIRMHHKDRTALEMFLLLHTLLTIYNLHAQSKSLCYKVNFCFSLLKTWKSLLKPLYNF